MLSGYALPKCRSCKRKNRKSLAGCVLGIPGSGVRECTPAKKTVSEVTHDPIIPGWQILGHDASRQQEATRGSIAGSCYSLC